MPFEITRWKANWTVSQKEIAVLSWCVSLTLPSARKLWPVWTATGRSTSFAAAQIGSSGGSSILMSPVTPRSMTAADPISLVRFYFVHRSTWINRVDEGHPFQSVRSFAREIGDPTIIGAHHGHGQIAVIGDGIGQKHRGIDDLNCSVLTVQLFQPGFDGAHFGAFNWVVRTDSRRDFRRLTVLAQREPGLLKGPASYGKRSGINHPVKRTIGTRFDDRGPAVLQFWVPVFVRERNFGLRYMAIGIPCLDHIYLKLRR